MFKGLPGKEELPIPNMNDESEVPSISFFPDLFPRLLKRQMIGSLHVYM
jgi:hypothetical protein